MSFIPPFETTTENSGGTPVPAPEQDITRLSPGSDFPEDLTDLSLVELQVLDSRLRCQIDDEVMSVDGIHPQTLDRHNDVAQELRLRSRRLIRQVGRG